MLHSLGKMSTSLIPRRGSVRRILTGSTINLSLSIRDLGNEIDGTNGRNVHTWIGTAFTFI